MPANTRTTTAIKAAIQELNATIKTLSRFPEGDTAATVALMTATTARSYLRDVLEGGAE